MSRIIRQEKRMFMKAFPWQMLIFSICGILCPLPYLLKAPWFTVSLEWMLLAALFPLLLVLLSRLVFNRGTWIVPVLILLYLGYFAWRLRLDLTEQVVAASERFMGETTEGDLPDLSLLAGCILVVWSFFFMFMERSIAGHIILSVILFGMLLFMPMAGLHIRVEAGVLWLIFFAGFHWFHSQKRQAVGKHAATEQQLVRRMHGASVGIISLLVLAFAAGTTAAVLKPNQLYETLFTIEGHVNRFLDRFTKDRFWEIEGEGVVSRSNCYPAEEESMLLYTDQKPSEPLFLRGFSGNSYENGEWQHVDETDMFNEMSKRLGSHAGVRLEGMYSSMYFMRNLRYVPEEDSISLAVKQMRGRVLPYAPYFSRPYTQFLDENGQEVPLDEDTVIHQYFERQDLVIRQDYEKERMAQLDVSYHMLENIYKKASKELYTAVPENRLKRLKALVEENPQDSLPDITAFILYTLQTRATYSLTPGRVPVNEDASEYFLFKSGKGYCEHFASAATLLYRMYGIPARYATGYRIDPDVFKHEEDGYWTAEVTDRQAHAWVEIFLTDYGWVPVDVTPVGGTMRTDYPGYDPALLNALLAQNMPEPDHIEDPLPDMEERSKQKHENIVIAEEEELPESTEKAPWPYTKHVLIGIAVLAALEGRRRLILWLRTKKNSRKLFVKLLAILHSAGLSKTVTGDEKNLSQLVRNQFPEVEMDRILRITEEEVFGSRQATAEEKTFLLHTISYAAGKAYANSFILKKLWLRWGRCWC